MKAKRKSQVVPVDAPLRLDLGSGPNKREGFTGVDRLSFGGTVDVVLDVRKCPWPWKDGSVTEAHSSHFVEHLTGAERIPFFNELWRVLAPEAKTTIITPHWASGRAYGDLTHEWPPVVEEFWYYLSREWRAVNAPHVPLVCNFHVTWGYIVHPGWAARNEETKAFAINHYRGVAQDMVATLTRKE